MGNPPTSPDTERSGEQAAGAAAARAGEPQDGLGAPLPTDPAPRLLARWLLIALACCLTGWLLWAGRSMLLPFLIGGLLAIIFSPLVNRLARHLPRPLAILTVYAGGLLLLIVAFLYIAPLVSDQIQQLIDSIPSTSRLQLALTSFLRRFERSVPAILREPIITGINNALDTLQSNTMLYLQRAALWIVSGTLQIAQTLTFLLGFVVIPFWLFYVLNSEAEGRAWLNHLLHPRIRADVWAIWELVAGVLSQYIRGQLILGLAVGVLTGAGMLILQWLGFPVPYILLLAIIAGVTELIPIIGPNLGAIPGVLVGLFVSPGTGLAMLMVYIIVQQLENNLLVLRIIGRSIAIHPAILTIILFAAAGAFGLVGIFVAAPLAAIGRGLFVYLYHRLRGCSPETAQDRLASEVAAEGGSDHSDGSGGDQ